MVWWDFRNDPGTHLNDVYQSVSNDNGQTWSPNRRITDQSINRKYGSWSTGFDMRQPPGIASTDDFTLIAWDDTRDADPVGQAQGLFGTALQYEALGAAPAPPSTRWPASWVSAPWGSSSCSSRSSREGPLGRRARRAQ